MTCPSCNGDTMVIDSRLGHRLIRRRRKCTACDYRFSTVEIEADTYKKMQADSEKVDEALQDIKKQLMNILRIKKG